MSTARRIMLALLISIASISIAVDAFGQDVGSFDDLKGDETDAVGATKKDHQDYMKERDLDGTDFFTEFRLGLLNLTGNTRSLSVSGGNHTRYRYKRFENNWKVGGYYSHVFSVRSQAGLTGTVARYIYGNYRFDYYITDRFSYFVGGGGYTDRFSGIELSGFGFTGFRYFFLKAPGYYLTGAGGYQYAYEDRVAPNPDGSFSMGMGELNYWQRFNDNVSFSNDLKLLENVAHGYDFRLQNKSELKVSMTKRLAIVLGFEIKFRNRPVPGFKKLDTITECMFSARF